MANVFKTAIINGYTFPSTPTMSIQGQFTLSDLASLSKEDLNELAMALNATINEERPVSFLEKKSEEKTVELNKLKIVISVLQSKVEAENNALLAKIEKEKNEKELERLMLEKDRREKKDAKSLSDDQLDRRMQELLKK